MIFYRPKGLFLFSNLLAFSLEKDSNLLPSDYAANFYQLLSRKFTSTDKNMKLIMIAYQDFLNPPNDVNYPENTIIYICPSNRDHGQLLFDLKIRSNALIFGAVNKRKSRVIAQN
jgi:hypothetical protein